MASQPFTGINQRPLVFAQIRNGSTAVEENPAKVCVAPEKLFISEGHFLSLFYLGNGNHYCHEYDNERKFQVIEYNKYGKSPVDAATKYISGGLLVEDVITLSGKVWKFKPTVRVADFFANSLGVPIDCWTACSRMEISRELENSDILKYELTSCDEDKEVCAMTAGELHEALNGFPSHSVNNKEVQLSVLFENENPDIQSLDLRLTFVLVSDLKVEPPKKIQAPVVFQPEPKSPAPPAQKAPAAQSVPKPPVQKAPAQKAPAQKAPAPAVPKQPVTKAPVQKAAAPKKLAVDYSNVKQYVLPTKVANYKHLIGGGPISFYVQKVKEFFDDLSIIESNNFDEAWDAKYGEDIDDDLRFQNVRSIIEDHYQSVEDQLRHLNANFERMRSEFSKIKSMGELINWVDFADTTERSEPSIYRKLQDPSGPYFELIGQAKDDFDTVGTLAAEITDLQDTVKVKRMSIEILEAKISDLKKEIEAQIQEGEPDDIVQKNKDKLENEEAALARAQKEFDGIQKELDDKLKAHLDIVKKFPFTLNNAYKIFIKCYNEMVAQLNDDWEKDTEENQKKLQKKLNSWQKRHVEGEPIGYEHQRYLFYKKLNADNNFDGTKNLYKHMAIELNKVLEATMNERYDILLESNFFSEQKDQPTFTNIFFHAYTNTDGAQDQDDESLWATYGDSNVTVDLGDERTGTLHSLYYDYNHADGRFGFERPPTGINFYNSGELARKAKAIEGMQSQIFSMYPYLYFFDKLFIEKLAATIKYDRKLVREQIILAPMSWYFFALGFQMEIDPLFGNFGKGSMESVFRKRKFEHLQIWAYYKEERIRETGSDVGTLRWATNVIASRELVLDQAFQNSPFDEQIILKADEGFVPVKAGAGYYAGDAYAMKVIEGQQPQINDFERRLNIYNNFLPKAKHIEENLTEIQRIMMKIHDKVSKNKNLLPVILSQDQWVNDIVPQINLNIPTGENYIRNANLDNRSGLIGLVLKLKEGLTRYDVLDNTEISSSGKPLPFIAFDTKDLSAIPEWKENFVNVESIDTIISGEYFSFRFIADELIDYIKTFQKVVDVRGMGKGASFSDIIISPLLKDQPERFDPLYDAVQGINFKYEE